jgi:hypothetical protein
MKIKTRFQAKKAGFEFILLSNPAVTFILKGLRPEALRPYLSAGLPFSRNLLLTFHFILSASFKITLGKKSSLFRNNLFIGKTNRKTKGRTLFPIRYALTCCVLRYRSLCGFVFYPLSIGLCD